MPTSTPVRRVWPVLVLGLACADCGGSRVALRSAPDASLPEAVRFDTAERPNAVLGARAPDALARAAAAAARDAGVVLRGDGRLALLARNFSEHCSRSADPRAISDAARRLGLVETALELACVNAANGDALPAALEVELGERLRSRRATHYGLYARNDAAVAVVLSQRPLALAPVPRRVEVGSPLRVRGRLDAVLGHPRLVVHGPNGERSWPAGAGPDFDLQVPTPRAGCYVLSISARSGERVLTLAELIIEVGDAIDGAGCALPDASGAAPSQLAAQARDLERRIAQLRIASGLPALATDAQLGRAAMQASAQPHATPSAPAARELGSGLVLLAVARAGDASTLWKAFTRDAAMRAKLLNPDVTHVGAGVRAGPFGYTAAVLVAQLAPTLDLELAPARVLEAINRNRGARSAPALRPDAELTRVARGAVRAFFEPPAQDEREIVARANAELERFGLSYRRVAALALLVADPLDAAALEPALDGDAAAAGIAVAAGVRPGSDARVIAVVIALGWDR
jgi:uncharacterized protein YkwD